MAASSRLPGFLRRSVLANDSEDEDDEESISSSTSSPQGGNPGGDNPQSSDDATASDNGAQQRVNAEEDETSPAAASVVGSTTSRTSMPSLSVPQPAVLNRQISEPRVVHASQTGTGGLPENPEVSNEFHRSQTTPVRTSGQMPPQGGTSASTTTGRPKSYRDKQFEKLFAANVVSMNDLKALAWNGIPDSQISVQSPFGKPLYRPQSWKIIFGYLPTNASRRQLTLQKKRAEYRDAIGQHYYIDDNSRTIQEQEVLRQVLVDVPRTAPDVQLFRDERIKKLLSRILYIWAMRHPASSYVQGINDLAMPLIITFLTEKTSVGPESNDDIGDIEYDKVLDGRIMESVSDERLDEVEADCYWCLTNLLAGIQDHYTSDQPGVQRMVLRLEELVNRIDADLCAHLRDTGIEFMQFAFKWMNCLLLREFKLKCVVRLWDTYISEKDGFEGFHVYVCAAFLCQFSSQLQTMSFDELFGFMQAMPTGEWCDTEIEMLLSQAYVLSTLFGGSDAHLIGTK